MGSHIIDVFVYFIGNDEYLRVAFQNGGQRFQLFTGIDTAGRVGGRTENEQLGLGRDSGLELGRCHLKILFDARLDNHILSFGEFDHLYITYPIRGGEDYFVSRIDKGKNRVTNGLFGSIRNDNLFRSKIESVFVFELRTNGLPQIHISRNRRIVRKIIVYRFFRGIFNMLGCIKIGFSHTQINHIYSLCFQFTTFL